MIENDRRDCEMRHENGNCLCVGGFCTAVNDEICNSVRSAYSKGYYYGYKKCLADKEKEIQSSDEK